jgi:uncharacterized integral membrane protein
MSRLKGIVSVLVVLLLLLLLAAGFAAANAGHRVTLELGIVTLYQLPVTLVALSGLFVGMLVMFATGIHADLKVRQILRERLSEESQQEQDSIDRNQRDLFSEGKAEAAGPPAAQRDDEKAPESFMEDPHDAE